MKKYRDERWLRKLYWDEGLSLACMAERADTTDAVINYWMKKFGIPRRTLAEAAELVATRNAKVYQNPDWLRQKYWDEGLSLGEVAKIAGCGDTTILKFMERFGIPRRSHADIGQLRLQGKPYTDPEWLREKYIGEKLNAYEIAALADCTHTTIFRWLENHGIERRSQSEASKLLWDKGVYAGEKHPQWRGGKWVECLNCGELTYRSPKRLRETNRQFCSMACLQEYSRGENHPCWKDKIELTCANCGGAFATHEHQVANGRRFCSLSCFGEYHSGENHYSWKGGEWIKCDNCGADIFKKFHSLERSKHHFCSRDCADRYFQGENHPLWDQVELTCQWCGETYSRCQSVAAISHFCSEAC